MLCVQNFSEIVSCRRCIGDRCLLRDDAENVPQPGYVGPRYEESRVVVVGQNPGVPTARLLAMDHEYTGALRAVRDAPGEDSMARLQAVFLRFAPLWPIQQYVPIADAGLRLEHIAWLNLVRCRTGGTSPSDRMVANCLSYFETWIDALKPRAVVFIGKWPYQQATASLTSRSIPHDFISRQKNLFADQRAANRVRVATKLRGALCSA